MSAAIWRIFLAEPLLVGWVATAAAAQPLSPLQTVELLHKAMSEADARTAAELLHADYHGFSLEGPLDERHVYVEARDKAISDIAALHVGAGNHCATNPSTQGWDTKLLQLRRERAVLVEDHSMRGPSGSSA